MIAAVQSTYEGNIMPFNTLLCIDQGVINSGVYLSLAPQHNIGNRGCRNDDETDIKRWKEVSIEILRKKQCPWSSARPTCVSYNATYSPTRLMWLVGESLKLAWWLDYFPSAGQWSSLMVPLKALTFSSVSDVLQPTDLEDAISFSAASSSWGCSMFIHFCGNNSFSSSRNSLERRLDTATLRRGRPWLGRRFG